jgi:MazG family protein
LVAKRKKIGKKRTPGSGAKVRTTAKTPTLFKTREEWGTQKAGKRESNPNPNPKSKRLPSAVKAKHMAVPELGREWQLTAAGEWFERLVALQATLRGPGGCPWDAEQTHESLRTFLIEEAYETLDALESGDAQKFAGELGDLLLQVIFHAMLAQEAGKFTIADVIEGVHSKMVRRHPHVFGAVQAGTSAQVLKNWEAIKADERKADKSATDQESILSAVPRKLPALLEAHQITRRAANIGFDWNDAGGIFDKIEEESIELRAAIHDQRSQESANGGPAKSQKNISQGRGVHEEVGDLLFAAVNMARFLGLDAEVALKSANRKFRERFGWMERRAAGEGRRLADVPRERMEELWNESKTKTGKVVSE